MFYAQAAIKEEEEIRRAGLERLRKKVYQKMMKYEQHKEWSKTENSRYL